MRILILIATLFICLQAQAQWTVDQGKAKVIRSAYSATLADNDSLSTGGWIDMGQADKYQIGAIGSTAGDGFELLIISASDTAVANTQLTTRTSAGISSGFFLINVPVRQRYLNISWINRSGGAVPATFELKQTFGSSDKLSVFPISITPSVFSQAALVQSILRGADINGAYQNVGVNTAGSLIVADFRTEASLGNVTGYSVNDKFGYTKDLDAADAKSDVWVTSSDGAASQIPQKTFPTATRPLYVVSTSTADTMRIRTIYQNASGVQTNGTTSLNGQTPALVSTGVLDCNRGFVFSADAEPAGTIFIMHGNSVTAGVPDTASTVLAVIPVGYGQTQQALDRVPSNARYALQAMEIEVSRGNGSAGSAEITLETKETSGAWRARRVYQVSDGAHQFDLRGLTLPSSALFRVTVDDISDTDTNVSGSISYIKIDN